MNPTRWRWLLAAPAVFALAAVPALLAADGPPGTGAPSSGGSPGPVPAARALPAWYEENRGQADPGVSHLARARGYTVLLSGRDAHLAPAGGGPGLRLSFDGIPGDAPAAAEGRLPGRSHYLIGRDSRRWVRGVRQSRGVRVGAADAPVAARWLAAGGNARFDLELAAGVDASVAGFRIEGARAVRLLPDGALAAAVGSGEFRLSAPRAFEGPGEERPVPSRFVPGEGGRIGFAVDRRDPSLPLRIDPDVSWATLVGGDGHENTIVSRGNTLALAGSGAVFVTGSTPSSNFPVTGGAFQGARGGSMDAFVLKMAADGSSLDWATYLGGTAAGVGDYGYGVAAGPSGSAVVVGSTRSTDFPVTMGAYDTSHNGLDDVFVARLASDGASLLFSTYIGTSGIEPDTTAGVAVAGDGSVWIAGSTVGTGYPTTPGAFQASRAGATINADVILTRLSADGTSLLYSTYFGGTQDDRAYSLALDASGNPTVGGKTTSALSGFPFAAALFDESDLPEGFAGEVGFVARFASDGTLTFSDILPGTNQVSGIATDGSGAVHATGTAGAASGAPEPGGTFPATAGAFQGTLAGESDAFVLKFSPDGSSLAYATLIGGSGADYGSQLSVDAAGDAWLAGSTYSVDFPLVDPFQDTVSDLNGTGADVFLARVSSSGSSLAFSTFFGTGVLWGVGPGGFAVDGSGSLYLCGTTSGPDGGTWPAATPGAFQSANAGGQELYVARFSPGPATLPPDGVDLVLLKGAATDSPLDRKDSVKLSGTFAYTESAGDGAFDPVEDTLVLVFGREDRPYGIRLKPGTPMGPGDEGWKSKKGKHTWKSGKSSPTKVAVVIDTVKGKWSVKLSKADLKGTVDEDFLVRLSLARDRGTFRTVLVENAKKPGKFAFTAP